MGNKWSIRILAVILAILLIGSVLFGVISSVTAHAAASQSAIDALESNADALARQKQELQSEINSLEYEQSSALAKKEVLDEQILLTQDEIDNTEQQIEEYTLLIAEKEVEVQAAEQSEKDQWDLFQTRMRVMEENGTISYLAVIFEASSFSDLLARIDIVGEVMTYDESLYDQLENARLETIAAKEELEYAKVEQEEIRVELVAREAELAGQVDEADALLATLESNLESYQALYDEAAADEAAVQAEIDRMIEELQRQESSGGGSVVSTGSFIWPTPSSYRVTSTYGTRLHPIYHVYKTHNGIDIGASYGASVLASDSGTVVTSKYTSSYGNYIVINHGGGTTTLYAHLSKRNVETGDVVTQGDVIGLIGSTGNSTGPHLHFEITVNGSRVNPLNYFTGYTIVE